LSQARYGQGLWWFGGAGIGGAMVNTSKVNPIGNPVNSGLAEQDKVGYALHVKTGPSWYIGSSFVLDAMLGWQYLSVSGKAPTGGEAVTIKHTLGLLQLSPRFRFGDIGKWQIGPLYKMEFGTDTSFTEREGQFLGEKPRTHYLGAHINFDMPSGTEQTIYRIGFEALKNMTGSRDAFKANLLFEIGFNLFGGEDTYESTEEPAVEEAPSDEGAIEENLPPEEAEAIAPLEEEALPEAPPAEAAPAQEANANDVSARSSGNEVFIRFPGDRFQFATGMSHIGSKQTREYLRELGEFLAQNAASWEKGMIVGHTDRRGPRGREREVNIELSEARARTVYNTLVAAGVNGEKLRYEGHAFDEPVPGAPDNAIGWKLNRRVELTFSGVRAPEALIEQINDLNRKYGYGRQLSSTR